MKKIKCGYFADPHQSQKNALLWLVPAGSKRNSSIYHIVASNAIEASERAIKLFQEAEEKKLFEEE